MRRPFALIEAPSVLGLRKSGVETLPEALLRAGLAERLGAVRSGRVQPPPWDGRRDPHTRMLNPHGIASYTRALADAVGDALASGAFPLVLGGDCTILLGALLALRRRGRYGLLFVDGHMDFYEPETNVNGEAASSELAFATGRGPEILTCFEGHRPLVFDSDLVVFGFRDAEEAASFGAQPLPPEVLAFDLEAVRHMGVGAAAHQAVAHLARTELDGFWIHLDVDVLDDAIMPAVDYRQPDGLRWHELQTLLRVAIDSGRAVGMEVTIFNPRLDPNGDLARSLVDALAAALHPLQPHANA